MKPDQNEEEAAVADVDLGVNANNEATKDEHQQEAQNGDPNGNVKKIVSKSVSFSQDQSEPSSTGTQPRLRGPLIDSSTAFGENGVSLNRPWPKDVNIPLKRLASSTTTSTSARSPGPCSCLSWSRQRFQVAAFGCTSSSLVLVIRLLMDSGPSAYVIHSVIVFVDMILIHLFTFSPWLSISGEMITIIFFLSFHFTNQKVFELLETTMIAALCSIHMIFSRTKHMQHEEKLENSLRLWHQLSLRSNPTGSSAASGLDRSAASQQLMALMNAPDENEADEDGLQEHGVNPDVESNSVVPSSFATGPPVSLHPSHNLQLFPEDDDNFSATTGVMRRCGANFFEHFLDGSAGVMYTSFVGLIVDDLINYGQSKECK